MSQLPVVAMLPVVFWFVVLGWRGRDPLDSWWRFDIVQLFILLLTLMAIGALYGAAHTNLVLDIDMQVDGYGSTNNALRWYSDRVVDALPAPAIVSVPEIVFRVVTFLWALWAVQLIVRSARWGWRSFSTDGWWKFPTPRTQRQRQPEPPPAPRDEPSGPAQPPPPPVPRHARDGEVVHVELDLSAARSRGVGLGVADTDSVVSEEDEEDGFDVLTTDDVIGALVDDSDVHEQLGDADTGQEWTRLGSDDDENTPTGPDTGQDWARLDDESTPGGSDESE
jgi:hypothetical protein